MAARMRDMCTSMERSKASRGSRLHDVHQDLARHDAPGVLRQRQQQIELIGGHRAHLAIEAHLSRPAIDLEPSEAQHVVFGPGLAAAQDGPEAGEQLTRLEWLG